MISYIRSLQKRPPVMLYLTMEILVLGKFAIVSIKKNCTLYRVMQSVFLSFYSHNRYHELLWSAHRSIILVSLCCIPQTSLLAHSYSPWNVLLSHQNGERKQSERWANAERNMVGGCNLRTVNSDCKRSANTSTRWRWTHGKGKMNDLIRIALELSSDSIQIDI